MVGYWCRVGSLALTHTHNDVAILVQWRTLLSICFSSWRKLCGGCVARLWRASCKISTVLVRFRLVDNGARLDRHGIRPSYLGLGGPPLLGLAVRPPRSVSHLYPFLTLMLRVLRYFLLIVLIKTQGLRNLHAVYQCPR